MATVIDFASLTDGNRTGTGYFDVLMRAVGQHINFEFEEGRILTDDYAEVQLGAIQAVLASSERFLLAKQLQEAQVDKMQEDILLAKEEVIIAKSNAALEKAKAIAMIDKEYGYNYTLDGDGYVVVGTSSEDGKLDAEVAQIKDTTHDQEWNRELKALKVQFDAEVDLFKNRRINDLPSFINGDDDAKTKYDALIANVSLI